MCVHAVLQCWYKVEQAEQHRPSSEYISYHRNTTCYRWSTRQGCSVPGDSKRKAKHSGRNSFVSKHSRGQCTAAAMPTYTRLMGHDRRRARYSASHHHYSNDSSRSSMSESTWQVLCNETTIHGNPAISPAAFAKGHPPDPTPSDSYTNKWLKLVWMELYDSKIAFEIEQSRKREPFEDRATLSVTVAAYDERHREYSVVIAGNDANSQYALPADVSAADFVHALLRLKTGNGWVYVKRVDTTSGSNRVTAFAHVYDEGFNRSESGKQSRQPCVLFDSFSGCLARFHALHRYPTVHASVRDAIEASKALNLAPAPAQMLKRFSSGRESKLNPAQLSILQSVQGPVDFVQGPPGTGKSTFIVELLETRIPEGNKVLLCTTTNKAIDSLAEKIHNCGHRNILAFGNASRLCETSLQLTLPYRVAAHLSMCEVQEFKRVSDRTYDLWARIKREAVKESAEEGGAKVDTLLAQGNTVDPGPNYETILKRRIEEKAKELEDRLTGAMRALNQYRVLSEHPDSVADLIQDEVDARPALASKSIELTKDSIERYVSSISGLFLNGLVKKVEARIKLHIFQTARFFVCTAASAVKLPMRVENELDGLGDLRLPEAADEDGLGGIVSKLAHVSVADSTDDDTTAQKSLLAKLLDFKHVVLDEAGAMLEPDMVGAIIHGCRFLLCVGDQHQLPPFTTWRRADEWQYKTSLLERLAKRPNTSRDHNLMTVQYRMHPHIANVVSSLFYEDKLTTASSVAQIRKREDPVRFIDVQGQEEKQGFSFKNLAEVSMVIRIVQQELRENPKQLINVIAFHKPQMFAIRKELELRDLKREGQVDVITVDSMQGREADVIVLSCVRTGSTIGFLKDKQRLNVALSRAKDMLYIVGDHDTLNTYGSVEWKLALTHRHVKLRSM